MSKHHLNLKSFIVSSIFLLFTSYAQAQILFGPEEFSTPNGQLKTVIRNLDLGDNPPGTYLIRLKNGVNGPALLDQCLNKTPIELKRQCQYDNLVDRTENQLTRVSTFKIMVNGVNLSSQTLLNKASSYLEFPVTLNRQVNELKISVQGNPEAFATMQVDVMPQESLPPKALFVLNSNHGRAPFNLSYNATQSFDPQNKAITYEWFVDNQSISTTKTGTRSFTTEGEYELKLVVTNADNQTSELSATIVVQPSLPPQNNIQPTAKMSISYPDPMNLRLIKVSALDSLDADGFITATQITFGDGTVVNATEALHEYAADGTYLVKVKVTDDDGSSNIIEKSMAIALNNQLSKVASVYGAESFYGSINAFDEYLETININAEDTAELYRIRIKNADGLDHIVQATCTGTTAEIIMCKYNNIVQKAYIALNRVDYAHVYLNDKKLTDSKSINKDKKSFETYVKLSEINQLKIKLKGWPTAYITVEIEKLGLVPDTTAPVLASLIPSGSLVRSNLVHIFIEDNSAVTTDVYKEGNFQYTTTDKEFDLTLTEGSNNFTLKSKDSLDNTAADFHISNITLDSTPSTIASPDRIQNYHFNVLPNTVIMHFEGNEELSSATVNGEALERVSPTKFKYTTQVFDEGLKFITAKIYDLAGNETSQNYNFNIKLDTVAPVITSTYAIAPSTKNSVIHVWMKVVEDANVVNVFKVNGQVFATNTLKSPQLDFPLVEGNNVLEAISTDQAGNVSEPLVANVVRDTTAPNLTISPTPGSEIGALSINFSGTSNEPLSQLKVGSQTATLTSDGMGFSYTYTTTTYGVKNLTITAKDILGNIATIPVQYTLQNPNAPAIAANITNGLITQNPNVSIDVTGNNLSNLKVNLNNNEIYNGSQTSFSFNLPNDGVHTVYAIAKNTSNVSNNKTYTVTLDRTAPQLTMTPETLLTQNDSVMVHFTNTDLTDTITTIKLNGEIFHYVQEKNFSFILPLNNEGNNTIESYSIDQAGNHSETKTVVVKKDTTGPSLTILSPEHNGTMAQMQFLVSGLSNEKLSEVKVNGTVWPIMADEVSFGGQYQASALGPNTIEIQAKDLVGNVSNYTVNFNITNNLLNRNLVTVIPSPDGNFYYVTGRPGASRANSYISVTTGIFSTNRGNDTTKTDGTFSVKLSRFTQATVTATDLVTDEEESFELDFYVPTSIAGVVKDYNDIPLPGATVTILGSGVTTQTDASGTFSLSDIPLGDQLLSIDGSTIPQATTGNNKKYFTTNMAVSISAGINNTLSRPIYLVPTELDGTQTVITSNQAATVTSPHAPGVSLTIPAGTVRFPTGQSAGEISVREIPSNRATRPVPANAVPDTVYAFQPSGTKFTERVQVSFPNVNELEPGQEAFVLSLNSTTGEWEINGVAKVSEDGASVTTKPGYGITHFSSLYVVPAKPYFESMQDSNLDGIHVAKGAYENVVELPSYKVFGSSITPKLKYNSSWANPVAVATNGFAVPKQEIVYDAAYSSYSSSSRQVPLIPGCNSGDLCPTRQILLEQWIDQTLNLQMGYRVDTISSQTWIGLNAFDQTNYTIRSAQLNPSDIPGVQPTNSIKTDKWTLVNDQEGNLIPNFSQISYAIPLRKPDGTNFPTGIYPSLTRYELKLKHLTIRTITTNVRVEVEGENVDINDNGFVNGVKVERGVSTYALESIFPKDIQSKLLVQNKEGSPFGKGWEFDPTQKIISHNASQILLEEADGSLSTYSAGYPIETILNTHAMGYDTTYGVGLNSWPNIYLQKYDTQTKQGKIFKVNGNTLSETLVSTISGNQGTSGLDNFDNCGNPNLAQEATRYKFSFTQKPGFSNILQLGNGTILGTNTSAHSLYNLTNSSAVLVGGTSYPAGMFNINSKMSGFSEKLSTVCTNLNLDCYDLTNLNTTYSCNSNIENHSETGSLLSTDSFPSTWIAFRGTEDFNDWRTYENGNLATARPRTYGFNSPSGMTISPDGKVIIADTGNNIVLALNPQTNMTKIIAGDFRAMDGGDGGPAAPSVIYDIVRNEKIQEFFVNNSLINTIYNLFKTSKLNAAVITPIPTAASIYHPKGLAYDSQGNLYITSENGYIRKVNPQGIISTYAGRSLEEGGSLGDSGHSEIIRLNKPTGIIIDSEKQLMYVADTGNHRILQIDMTSKMVTKIAGNDRCDLNPNDGGSALNASLCSPTWLGFDDQKNVLVLDNGTHASIRKIKTNLPDGIPLAYHSSRSGDSSTITKNTNNTFLRKTRDGQQFFFTSEGKQTLATDRIGNVTAFEYDSYGRIERISYPNGLYSNYNYSDDHLDTYIDPAGRTTRFIFSGSLLSQIVFPDNTFKTFIYDGYERIVKSFDQKGYQSQITYNDLGKVKTIKDNEGKITLINDVQEATLNNPKQVGSADGKISAGITNAKNVSVLLAEDMMGYLVKYRDGNGVLTEIKRDFDGRPLKITKNGGTQSTTFTYSESSKDLTSIKNDRTGQQKSYTYNEFGQILTESDYSGNLTSYSYTSTTGLLISMALPSGINSNNVYNSRGQIIQTTSYTSGSNQYTTTYEYDSIGNLIKTIYPDGRFIRYEYDLAGNNIKTILKIDENNLSITTKEFDLHNRLKKVISPKGEITQFTYDSNGNLDSVISPDNKTVSYSYNKNNKIISKTVSSGKQFTYAYDDIGNMVTETDPNNNVKQYTYSNNNTLLKAQFPDETIEYTYDILNQLVGVSSSSLFAMSYSYNDEGYMTSEIVTDIADTTTYSMLYTYNENGKKSSAKLMSSMFTAAISPPSTTLIQEMNYSYDIDDRLIQISNIYGDIFGFNYDNSNRITSITRPGSRSDFVFGPSTQVSQIIHSSNSITKSFTEMTYDDRNFAVQKRNPNGTYNISHDKNGQIISSINSSINENESFSYNSVGNRVSDNVQNYDYSENFDNIITEDSQYTYLHDNNGNLTYKNSKQGGISYKYNYSSRNQLKSIQVFDAPFSGSIIKEINYTYDPIGRRVKKSVSDYQTPSNSFFRRFIYDADNIIAEIDSQRRVLATYTHSPLAPDDILAVNYSSHSVAILHGGDAENAGNSIANQSGRFYFLKDQMGSISDIIDANGNIRMRYNYMSFGKFSSLKNSSGQIISFSNAEFKNTFTFTGREWDNDAEMYYYRARYYDANIGRFIQSDPNAGQMSNPISMVNKYTYCGNSPTSYTDPSGAIFGIDDITFIILMGIAGSISESHADGDRYTLNNVSKGFIKGAALGASIIGVSNIIGSIYSGFSGSTSVTHLGTINDDLMLRLFKGFISPSLGAEITAGALGMVAGVGMFDPSADDSTKNFANNFLAAGSTANLLKAIAYTLMPTDSNFPDKNFIYEYNKKKIVLNSKELVDTYSSMIWKMRALFWVETALPLMR